MPIILAKQHIYFKSFISVWTDSGLIISGNDVDSYKNSLSVSENKTTGKIVDESRWMKHPTSHWWPTPSLFCEMQRFMSLTDYINQHHLHIALKDRLHPFTVIWSYFSLFNEWHSFFNNWPQGNEAYWSVYQVEHWLEYRASQD